MQSSLDSFISSSHSIPQPIATSQEVRDRASIFVANIFAINSVQQAKVVIAHLRNVVHGSKRATHEISAWRCMVLKQGKSGLGGEDDFEVVSGFDDDGETYGGDRILKVMKSSGIIDAVVIVSRWYGGVLLGPARFSHIEMCAQEVCHRFKLKEDVEASLSTLSTLDDILATLHNEYATLAKEQETITKKKPDYSSFAAAFDLPKLKRLVTARENAITSMKHLIKKATSIK